MSAPTDGAMLLLGTSFGQADKGKEKADNIAGGCTGMSGWPRFSFCTQQRKSHKVSNDVPQ